MSPVGSGSRARVGPWRRDWMARGWLVRSESDGDWPGRRSVAGLRRRAVWRGYATEVCRWRWVGNGGG